MSGSNKFDYYGVLDRLHPSTPADRKYHLINLDKLNVDTAIKNELKQISPYNYTGI